VGAIVAGPVGAAIGGVSGGALAGIYTRFRDNGISDKFMKETSEEIAKGKSALFLQYEGNWELSRGAVADAIKADDAKLLYSTLDAEHIADFQSAVEEAADELGGEESVTDYEVEKVPEHKPDDLTQLDGIGTKTAAVLSEAGLDTYEELSKASEPQLREIMHDANMVAPHSLTTWPMQASFAAKADWQGLFAYNQKQADKKAPAEKPQKEAAAPAKSDDLTQIFGIGPRMSDILAAGGITTYAELAASTPDQLKIIISAGGALSPSSLSTWPAQAAFADKGDWAGLAAYNKKNN
jgi:predicted flap endonuclease-1-like 5' DNA nuclease